MMMSSCRIRLFRSVSSIVIIVVVGILVVSDSSLYVLSFVPQQSNAKIGTQSYSSSNTVTLFNTRKHIPYTVITNTNQRTAFSSRKLYGQTTTTIVTKPTTIKLFQSTSDKLEEDIDEVNNSNNNNNTNNNWTWIVSLVFPLWLVYISNQWSRYSISYLVDFSSNDPYTAMNIDLGFNQVQYGVLASVAFTALYAITSLGAGIAADKIDRKVLTVTSCLLWAAATLGTALADNYDIVILWRIVMGFACAFATPTAYTLIQQNVPPNRVALGSSLYGTGVALGSGLSSLSIILDNAIGWRQTEIIIAILGFVAATFCAVVLPGDNKSKIITTSTISEESKTKTFVMTIESEKVQEEKEVTPSFASTLSDVQTVVSISRVQWIYLASFLRFCAGISIGVWGAPYFRMVFPTFGEEYSVTQAAISVVGATTSGILGGSIADYLSEQKTLFGNSNTIVNGSTDDPVARRLWVPVIGSILAAPAWYLSIQAGIDPAGSFELSMLWLAAEYLVAECWFGPTISSLQATVGPKIGGTAQGLFSLTGAAANAAPALLGYLYGQAVTSSSSSTDMASSTELSSLLIAGVCFGYLSSAFCFAMASLAGPTTDSTKEVKAL